MFRWVHRLGVELRLGAYRALLRVKATPSQPGPSETLPCKKPLCRFGLQESKIERVCRHDNTGLSSSMVLPSLVSVSWDHYMQE